MKIYNEKSLKKNHDKSKIAITNSLHLTKCLKKACLKKGKTVHRTFSKFEVKNTKYMKYKTGQKNKSEKCI